MSRHSGAYASPGRSRRAVQSAWNVHRSPNIADLAQPMVGGGDRGRPSAGIGHRSASAQNDSVKLGGANRTSHRNVRNGTRRMAGAGGIQRRRQSAHYNRRRLAGDRNDSARPALRTSKRLAVVGGWQHHTACGATAQAISRATGGPRGACHLALGDRRRHFVLVP